MLLNLSSATVLIGALRVKTYAVGTQKNHLSEMVLLGTKPHMFWFTKYERQFRLTPSELDSCMALTGKFQLLIELWKYFGKYFVEMLSHSDVICHLRKALFN